MRKEEVVWSARYSILCQNLMSIRGEMQEERHEADILERLKACVPPKPLWKVDSALEKKSSGLAGISHRRFPADSCPFFPRDTVIWLLCCLRPVQWLSTMERRVRPPPGWTMSEFFSGGKLGILLDWGQLGSYT